MPPQFENNLPPVNDPINIEPKKNHKDIIIVSLVILLVAIIILAGFLFWQRFGPQEDWSSSYYASLAKECRKDSCCISSARFMADYDLLLAENGKCQEGFKTNQEQCVDSYQWCEPNQATSASSTSPVIGGDKDAHGCLIAAGYSWCEVKNKCLRTWEELCKAGTISPKECIQVITPAKNIKTGEVRDFPTPCDVPDGWEVIR